MRTASIGSNSRETLLKRQRFNESLRNLELVPGVHKPRFQMGILFYEYYPYR